VALSIIDDRSSIILFLASLCFAMAAFRWTPERMEQLEHAVRRRKRVLLRRRGNEYVVVASAITTSRGREALAGYLAMTGDDMLFILGDLDHFQVIDP
jgi:hypothetical protein